MTAVGDVMNAGKRHWQVLIWIALAGYCLFSGIRYAENIQFVQAYGGWSPMDWVNHQLYPENFKKDFPSGIAVYRMSSFMHLYLLAARVGIVVEAMIPWVIVFEVVLLGMGAAFVFRALAPKSSYVAMAIFAILVVEGSVRDMELARFGGSFYQGLFYNVADGLRLLGLALLFRGRPVLAACLLGISFTVHPVMAGMACLFALPFVLIIWRQIPLRKWLFAFAGFVTISSFWLALNLQSAEVASGGIPSDVWLSLVRMFSYHWYPVDIGVFTRWHERYVLPLICLAALAVFYLPRVIQGRAVQLSIAWGMLLLGVLASAGVLISEFASEPFLIKLALHRASDMLILVSLLIVVAGLTGDVLSGRPFVSALAGALILSPLVNAPVAFPIIPSMWLLGLYAWKVHHDGETPRSNVALVLLIILLVAVSVYYLLGIPKTSAYVGNLLFWIVFSALLLAFTLLKKLSISSFPVRSLVIVIILATVLALSVDSVNRKSVKPAEWKNEAADYLAVQRWARVETQPAALFMVDPTIYYGWRDFSQRSSYGNLREWLHTGWLYDSRASVYEEGLKRFGEFAIDITPYKHIHPSIDGYHRLSDDLKQEFYGKDAEWFVDLSRKYGIDYLVVYAKHKTKHYGFEQVFANSTFLVFRLPR